MNRRLFTLALFLLLGAILNVAVAWGFSIRHTDGSGTEVAMATALHELQLQFGSSLKFQNGSIHGRENNRLGFSGRSIDGIRAGSPPALYSRFDFSAGWPARSLRGAALVQANQLKVVNATLAHRILRILPPSYLPLRPIWAGLSVNTIIYAGIVWVVLGLLKVIRGHIRELLLRCPECGYDLRGDFSAGCPECGWRREEEG